MQKLKVIREVSSAEPVDLSGSLLPGKREDYRNGATPTANALDEECRAKKALNLLEARDRRIAFLEKRVAELEETAIGMHTMSLRASSTLSSLDDPTNKDAYYSITQSEQSVKLENDYKNLDSSSNEHDQAYDQSQRFSMNQTMVPNLKLSSSTSYTDKEIFSTPALDMTYQKISNYLYVGSSDISTNYEMKSRSISETIRDYRNETSPIEDNRSTFVSNIDIEKRSKKKDELKFHSQKNEEITYMLPKSRNCNTGFPSKVSSSVAWIRTKRNFRKKIRPFATRVKRQQKGDQRAEKIDVSSFRIASRISGPPARTSWIFPSSASSVTLGARLDVKMHVIS
uniref:Uncharacterized protein n=1 Tax=Vespula pensylvanica TaxID=30213 RepID=A0A834P1U6_VESPE|nr:hypothetical protein H0235_007741 [Vespula pensylvanica]